MSRLLRVKLSPQVLNGFLCRGYCWLSRQNHPVITGLQLCRKECKSQNHLVKFLRYNGAVTHLKCQHTLPPGARPQKQKSVVIKPDMTVRQLAQDMGVQPASVADLVIDLGEELQNGFNTVLSPDLAELLLLEYDMIPIHLEPTETTRTSTSMLPRPPVVTIMGHVDHGKTTLLDTLRKTSVAAGEAGGITQHIGAFSVHVSGGERTITFIDTPGHAAFETMRARGANITDVVVLVVAADEGVKPQTVESIKHATNARVPIIVAVNKMDKPRVNVEKAKQQLLQHGIQLEEFGGDIQAVEISALKGTNLDGLLEAINTLAELQDLRAKRDGLAEGVVLEARKDSGKGSVATVLIKSGSLQRGSVIHTDQAFAKVRVMFNDRGQVVSKATPSTPVEVLGWRDLPAAGDELVEVESEQEAHKIVNRRKTILHEQKMEEVKAYAVVVEPAPKGAKGAPREPLRKEDNSDKLNIVVKGDVIGSVEAICDALNTYTSRRVKLTLLSAGVGPVSETDLRLAAASEGVVYGFNVKISKQMKTLAKQLGISVNLHEIIYKLLEDLKDDLSSRLPPREEEELVGEAVILKVFELTGSRKAVVGGCRVKKGYLVRDSQYRITRGHECVYEGKLSSMKRGLEDIGQAKRETECGLSFVKCKDVQEGDIVQCYNTTVMKQQIDWEWGF